MRAHRQPSDDEERQKAEDDDQVGEALQHAKPPPRRRSDVELDVVDDRAADIPARRVGTSRASGAG
jgi:hypothetical protein